MPHDVHFEGEMTSEYVNEAVGQVRSAHGLIIVYLYRRTLHVCQGVDLTELTRFNDLAGNKFVKLR